MAAARQYEFNTGPENGWDHRHPAKSGPKVSPYELISSSLQIARNVFCTNVTFLKSLRKTASQCSAHGWGVFFQLAGAETTTFILEQPEPQALFGVVVTPYPNHAS